MTLRNTTLRRLVVLSVLGLVIAYVAVLRPLALRVIADAEPMRALRDRLAQATLEAGLSRDTDFLSLHTHLRSLQTASEAFAAAEREARPRLEHPREVRRRLEEPFQLFEFLNESQRRLEELGNLAQARHVALTLGLPRGFPRYQPELAHPELLWVQLATVNRVIRTAILAGVREVSEVSVEPLPLLEPFEIGTAPQATPAAGPASTNAWSILRIHTTVIGNVDALEKLLLALALVPEEVKSAGLPEELGAHPALFIERLLLRRHQLEAAEQAQLELVATTVVSAEEL